MRLQTNRFFPAATAVVAGLFTFAGSFVAGTASAAQDPLGVWMNDTGRGAIEIKNCSTGLCGHVVWVKAGVDSMGCGKQIIGEAKPAGDGTWEGGWIYNPDKKKRYDVELEPQANGTLRVMGFAGVRFLSKTMIWKPAPDDLVRCDANAELDERPAARPAARTVTKATTYAAAEAPEAPAPKAAAPAKPEVAAPVENEDEVVVDTTTDDEGKYSVNLDEGIEVGDVFSMKRNSTGKCKIKAPFVDITVDCDRNKKDNDDDND